MAYQAGVGQRQQQHVQMEVPEQRVRPSSLLGQRVQQENRKTPVERRFAAGDACHLQQVGNDGHSGQHKGQEGSPKLVAGVVRSDRFGEPEQQEPDQEPEGEVPCPFEGANCFYDHGSGFDWRSDKHLGFAERHAFAVFF